ncbi:MAG: GlxA family transcriptional regulator [Granulosicoccaceae bacterium]
MKPTRHIVFALCPHLPLLAIASALELLRHANRACGFEAYQWSLVSEDDRAVQDTTGLQLTPNCRLDELQGVDALYVVAGFGAADWRAPRLEHCLKRLATAGATLGGISNGSYLLAKSGLLDGYQSTVHWEDFERFLHDYPAVHARYQRYVIDRKRHSCSGATSTFDLFLELIERELGKEIALRVSMQMLLHSEPLAMQKAEFPLQHQWKLSPRLQRAISAMEASGDSPPTVESLAVQLGMSRRSLHNLFQREVGIAPKVVLQQLRLNRVQALLQYSELSLSDIAEATGYSSQSHMTLCYKRHFSTTPAITRAKHRSPIQGS